MPSYWQETPSCYNLSHPSLSCRTSLCSFLQCQGLAELHLMWFVQALIMHLQDARCMNSFSNRSAGRLLTVLCRLPEMGEARGPHRHARTRAGRKAWEWGMSCYYEGVTASSRWGQAEDNEYYRSRSSSRKVLTRHPRNPCGTTWGVHKLTGTLGDPASRAQVLPRWRVLSLNITETN